MNYLVLGDIIVERLRSKITSVDYIQAVLDLSSLSQTVLITPAIYVYYVGDDLGDNAGRGMAFEVKQTWAVVAAIKNLHELEAVRRQELGELVGDIITAIQGWRPDDKRFYHLYREKSPSPVENPGGYAFFPIYFSSKFITTGDANGY